MAYTVNEMIQHAELHYFSARKALERAEARLDGPESLGHTQRAHAEAQCGLLALELARWEAQ